MSSSGLKAWGIWYSVLAVLLSIYVGVISSKNIFSGKHEVSGGNFITIIVVASYLLLPAILAFSLSRLLDFIENQNPENTRATLFKDPPKMQVDDNDSF